MTEPTGPLAASTAASSFEVLQALPGQSLDFYLDGQLLAADVGDGSVIGPIELPATGRLEVFAADGTSPAEAAERDDAPLVDTDVSLDASAMLVVRADDAGQTAVVVHDNDLEPLAAGAGRFTAHDLNGWSLTIDGEAIDVDSTGTGTADVEPGSREISVVDADGVVVVSDTVDVPEGELTSVFVVPTDDGANHRIVVRRIGGLASAPAGIPSGTGGLRDDSWTLGAIAAMASALTLVGSRVRRREAAAADAS